MPFIKKQFISWVLIVSIIMSHGPAQAIVPEPKSASDFYAFESDPVRPLVLTPDKTKLVLANIPDGHLDIFTLDTTGDITHDASVPVGMEPVAVAAPTNTEVWVVNQLSDSISIVDIGKKPYTVIRTLLVGDEPRDIVFAGPDRSLAFITTAHRGQHRSHPSIIDVPGAGDPRLTTSGIPRADVWVFDRNNLGSELGGKPKKIIELFGDTPRPLAVSPDGSRVYAGIFLSGNQTTIVADGVVPDTPDDGTDPGETYLYSEPITPELPPVGLNEGKPTLPGGLMIPLEAWENQPDGSRPVETGLIVKFDNEKQIWYDFHGKDPITGDTVIRNWNYGVRFTLPDYDVFEIDASSPSLPVVNRFAHVGTVLFNMAVNPVSGKLFVTNSDANNLRRYAGPPYTVEQGLDKERTYSGEMHYARISVIDPIEETVSPVHLNKHIDYTLSPGQMAVTDTKYHSVGTPLSLVFGNNGQTLYVSAFGSSKVAVFDTADLETNTFVPNESSHITVTGGGPCGLALDEDRKKLYVATRWDNGLSVIDLVSNREVSHHLVTNPEPESFQKGRPYVYDAFTYSENGEASCANCHVFGGWDGLAWDIGIPVKKTEQKNALCIHGELSVKACREEPFGSICDGDPSFTDETFLYYLNGDGNIRTYNTMPGPQVTPSFKGIMNHGHLHWRGDLNNRYGLRDYGPVLEDEKGNMRNNPAVCWDWDNPFDYDEMLGLQNLTTAHPGFNGNVFPKVTPDDLEQMGRFLFELMQPPNPVRNLDNSLTPSQKRGRDYYFGSIDAFGMVTHHASGAPPLMNGEDHRWFIDGEPTGFTCNDCHRVSPEHGFYGTDGHAAPSGEGQVMKTAQLRNMYQKVGMFGLPDRGGFRTYPGGNRHTGDQVRGFGFQNSGHMDTLFNYLQGEVFASDKYENVGFKTQQQRRDVQAYLLAFENDLAPIVGQQMTLNSQCKGRALRQRVKLMQQRAAATWEAKECGGSSASPVTECDLVARGIIDGENRTYLFNPNIGRYISIEENQRLRPRQLFRLAKKAGNSLTFTAFPPGAGLRAAATER